MHVTFLVPGNILHNSGGNVFNARLTEGLRALGVEVDVVPVDGSWPDASAKERRRLGGLLGAWRLGTWKPTAEVPPGTVTLVDGLIACGAPDEVEYAAAAGQRTWVLLHMPSSSHPDGEKRALRAAAGVICTSASAAAHVSEKYGLSGRAALPGTDAAPLAVGSEPPHIIAVAALLPNKDQLLIVAALALLQDLAWSASLVGTADADPAYAELVRSAIASHRLEDRVRMTGELTGKSLADEWKRADLSLLVSKAESFGLVVTESLAHGIPVIVREGTGAVDALGMGSSTPHPRVGEEGARLAEAAALPGTAVGLAGPERDQPEVLAAVIRRWLSDAALRDDWGTAAVAARDRLPGWDVTAMSVLEILTASAAAPTGTATATSTPAQDTPTAGGTSSAQ